MLKNVKKLPYTYFYNISLNVLRPNFFSIHNLPFSYIRISRRESKLGHKLAFFVLHELLHQRITELQLSIIVCTFNCFDPKYAFKTHRNIETKNEWLIVRKTKDTLLFSILLEMCVQSLKSIVQAVWCLSLWRVHLQETFPQRNPSATSNSL